MTSSGTAEGRSPASALAAVLIGVNWFVYIYGVNTDRVIETSLGYFINPLISVLFGVLVFRERLAPAQWIAIGLGAARGRGHRRRLRPAALDRAHAGRLIRLVRPGEEAPRPAADGRPAGGVVGARAARPSPTWSG